MCYILYAIDADTYNACAIKGPTGERGVHVTTIRELRQARGWTQYELALKVGVHPQAVYLWETGRRTPQVPQMRRLGQAFGMCSDEIDLTTAPGITTDVNRRAGGAADATE
jgi:DNA-binding XRE family transcriptional regulator